MASLRAPALHVLLQVIAEEVVVIRQLVEDLRGQWRRTECLKEVDKLKLTLEYPGWNWKRPPTTKKKRAHTPTAE